MTTQELIAQVAADPRLQRAFNHYRTVAELYVSRLDARLGAAAAKEDSPTLPEAFAGLIGCAWDYTSQVAAPHGLTPAARLAVTFGLLAQFYADESVGKEEQGPDLWQAVIRIECARGRLLPPSLRRELLDLRNYLMEDADAQCRAREGSAGSP